MTDESKKHFATRVNLRNEALCKFEPFLVGNQQFDECAIDVIEHLLEQLEKLQEIDSYCEKWHSFNPKR